jgi:hypothetical protein
VLVRIDGAGSTHALLDWLAGQRLAYSVGFGLPDNTADLLIKIPESVWTPAYDAHDQVRDGAWVAELTGLLNLQGWPKGMRVICRKERPHPGAQLRLTDIDGLRVTAFATNTPSGQLPDLELRHPPRRADRLDANARPRRPRSPPVGAETAPPPAVHDSGRPRPHRPTSPAPPRRQGTLG